MVVLDTAGKPQAGQAVELRGEQRHPDGDAPEDRRRFYAYDAQEQVRDLGRLCSGKTDARGLLTCDLDLAASGGVRLIAQTTDGGGRPAPPAARYGSAAAANSGSTRTTTTASTCCPKRRDLRPGETARLQVRMPFREATVLVTVEREGILDAASSRCAAAIRSSRCRSRSAPPALTRAEAASWAPTSHQRAGAARAGAAGAVVLVLRLGLALAAAVVERPRQEGPEWTAPTALVDLAKAGVQARRGGAAHRPDDHRLTVKVEPKTQYGVRQTARTGVQVLLPGRSGRWPAARCRSRRSTRGCWR